MNTTPIGARRHMRLATGAALTALALTLSACGNSGTTGEQVKDTGGTGIETTDQSAWDQLVAKAKEEGEVTVFVSPNVAEAVKAFEKEYGIKVTVERQTTTDLLPRLDQELSVPKPSADVAWHSSVNWFKDKSKQKLLAPVQYSPEVAQATASISERTRYYAPIVRNPFMLGYNTKLAEKPTSVQDAVKIAKAKGLKVGLLGISSPATAYQWMTWDKNMPGLVDDLAGVNHTMNPSLIPVAQAMAAGEYGYVFPMAPSTIDKLVAQGAPVAQVVPAKDATAIQYGAGILAKAPHPNAAQLFVNWLLSPKNNDHMLESFGPGAMATKGTDGLKWDDLVPFEESGLTQKDLDSWVATVFDKKLAK